jgi:hypothetical protein
VRLVFILLLAAFSLPGAFGQESRKFSAADGSFSGMAALVNLETDKSGAEIAVLRRESDGRVVKVALSRLSPEDVTWIEGARMALAVPEILRGRLTLEDRARLRRESGSDPAAEVAVEAALSWLSGRQNQDGSWGMVNKSGMTGLVLLAMAGNGHGPGSPVYGNAVKRGTAWLAEVAAGNVAPFTGIFSDKPSVISSVYEHAIATQGLAEVYALSPRGKTIPPALKEIIEKALDIIVKKQNPRGAWSYRDGIGYDPAGTGRDDLSVSCWQIHALWTARTAGFQRERMPAALKKAANYLESTRNSDAGFGSPNRTAHYNQWNLSGGALSGLFELKPDQFGKQQPAVQPKFSNGRAGPSR